MKKKLLYITTILLLFISSVINSSMDVKAADVLAKDMTGVIDRDTENTICDARYAFSLRANSETTMKFWMENSGGREADYNGKIIISENPTNVTAGIHPDNSLSGKVGIYIYNVGYYQGKQIDVKCTYSWNTTIHNGINVTPIISPYFNWETGYISHYYTNMSYEVKWDILYNNKPINIDMSASFGDIDNLETTGFKLNDGTIKRISCSYDDTKPSDAYNCQLYYKNASGFHYFYGPQENYLCNEDPSGMLRFELENVSSFSTRYIFCYDRYNYLEAGYRRNNGWDGMKSYTERADGAFDSAKSGAVSTKISGGSLYTVEDISLTQYGWYYYNSTPIGYYAIPAPTKGLEKMTSGNPLTYVYDITDGYICSIGNGGSATNTFAIMQYVPPLNTKYATKHYYKNFSITDTLPENENAKAEYVSANVLDINRTDVSDWFDITEKNDTVTATAKEEYLSQDGFYNNTYILRIVFKFVWKNQTVLSETLLNTASVAVTPYQSSEPEVQKSNEVAVKAVRKKLIIEKRWEDSDNADGLRPENITATLLADYCIMGSPVVKDIESGFVILSKSNDWKGYLWIDDPAYQSDLSYTTGTYQYHWKELSVPESYVSETHTEGDETVITNTHNPETTQVVIKKEWDDDNDRDRKRPQSITADIKDGDRVVTGVDVSSSDGWIKTVSDLIKNKNGQPINYTVKEHSVGYGYSSSVTKQSDGTYVITNTRTPEKVNLTVKKEWNDSGNTDGIRPDNVTMALMADGSEVKTYSLSAGNDWTVTTEDLNKYDEGRLISYSWVEKDITDGYTASYQVDGNTTTVTNTYEKGKVGVTCQKIWNDDNDRDAIRPESVDVTLKANERVVGTYKLESSNSWTVSVNDLDEKEDGAAISYTWEEKTVTGYTSTQSKSGNTTTITNTHNPARISLTVKKEWNDDNDRDGLRKDFVSVTLKANGTDKNTYQLSESNGWTVTVNNLYKNENGHPISYNWKEDSIDEYVSTQETTDNVTTITNSHTPEQIKLTVHKVWEDRDNADGLQPEDVDVVLKAGRKTVNTYTLSKKNDWTITTEDLNKYDSGDEIAYTWEEKSVNGYKSTQKTVGNVTTITNTHVPDKVSVQIKKVWEDDNNADGLQKDSVNVTLFADGNKMDTYTITKEAGWTLRVDNLTKNKKGTPIAYTWQEESIPEGYRVDYNTDGYNTVITNSHEAERVDVFVEQHFEDYNDADGLRPKNVIAVLYKNNKPLKDDEGKEIKVDLSDTNSWSDSVKELLKNTAGIENEYRFVLEKEIPEYETSYKQEGNKTIITSVHEPEKISLNLTKKWNDHDDADGIRPETAEFILKADNENTGTYTVSKEKDWKLTVDNLIKNKKGKAINYTWDEIPVNDYIPIYDTNEYETVVTNVHYAECVNLFVRQEWDDYDDADGLRPDEVTAVLYADGEPAKDQDGNPITVNLADKDGWNDTILDVLKNKDGKPIEYSFVQEPVPNGYTTGYSMDGDTFVITSVHEPERVNLTVEKQWNDHDDADGLRPESISVVLLADKESTGTYTVSKEKDWKLTVDNLIKNKKGNPIEYTWQEESIPEGYRADYNTDGYDTTIINTHKHDLTSTTLKKFFDDADDADGIRPESIDFKLIADGKEYGVYTLSEDNNWETTVKDLDMNKAGENISYTWEELNVPEGYEAKAEVKGSLTEITNTHQQETIDISLEFIFSDDNNRDGIRPESVEIALMADEKEVGVYTLSEDNNTLDLKNLPKNKNGKAISYTFVQKGTPNKYDIEYDAAEKKVVITDIHVPEKVTATVKKIWKDNNNASGLRPKSIQAALFINGVKSGQTVTLSEENNWEASISDLYRYENGTEVVYTFGEVNIPEGYDSGTELTGLSTVITNTLREKETEETAPEITTEAPEATKPVTTVKETPGDKSMISPKTGYDFTGSLVICMISGILCIYSGVKLKKRLNNVNKRA